MCKICFETKNIDCFNLDLLLFWIFDIALFLKKNACEDILLYFYDSRLMKDYYNSKNKNFEGFKSIDNYLNSNGIIEEKVFDADE